MSRWIVCGAVFAAAVGMSAVSAQAGQAQVRMGTGVIDDWVSVAAANSDYGGYDAGSATHSCGLRENASLWCWGLNSHGELGLGDSNYRYRPTQVGTGTNWLSVSVGESDTCAIKTPGTLWCWGLSFGTAVPRRVGAATDWVSISAGGYLYPNFQNNFRCGIRSDGGLWCWGDNSSGQLGLGDLVDRSEPTKVSDGWRGVAAGITHTCGVRTDGSLWCWGSNYEGELGLGDDDPRLVPAQVDPGSVWRTVAPGSDFTCGIHQDGGLWCWGWGGAGQLGNGGTDTEYSPVPVDARTDWSDVSTGYAHSCASRVDGSLWCWGDNDEGQVGIGGSPSRQLTPARVGTSSWTAIATGGMDSCGVQSDHTLWCWGLPVSGELGVGNRTLHTAVPIQVGLQDDPKLVSYSLSAVDVLTSDDVWVVGETRRTSTRPWVERWDGSSWQRLPAVAFGDASSFNDVAAVSARDVWAVGSYSLAYDRPLIEHWDGSSWSRYPVNDAADVRLTSVSAYASDDIWAVGYTTHNLWYAEAVAYHYDGTKWTQVATAPMNPWSNQSFLDVEMLSPTDVWAVGWGRKDDEAGALPFAEHWDGQRWAVTSLTPGASYDDHYLRSIAAVSPKRVWALGDFTQNDGKDELTLARLWNGKRWEERQVPDPGVPPGTYLRGAVAAAGRDVWAVGQTHDAARYLAFTSHFDGARWTQVTTPSPPNGDTRLNAVDANGSDDVWAVGLSTHGGVDEPLVEHWDGSVWTIVQHRFGG